MYKWVNDHWSFQDDIKKLKYRITLESCKSKEVKLNFLTD